MWVVVASQTDVGRERNQRGKVRQLRSESLIPATTAAEISVFRFVSMRGARIWSQLLKSMKEKENQLRKVHGFSGGFSMFSGDRAIVGEVNGVHLHSLVNIYVLVYLVCVFV